MLNDPKILMLDEPTAGLDPKERVRFRNLIGSLSADRIVILSTHIVSDMESIANKIVLLKDKKIFRCDTTENICAMLDGKVFEAEMLSDELPAFSKRHFVLSERFEGSTAFVRFVGDGSEGTPKSAGLEDVFLYLYRDEKDK